jgi:FkbH-like protein
MCIDEFDNALSLELTEWLRLQDTLLNGQLSRIELADLRKKFDQQSTRTIRVRIWRNYACEPMEPILSVIGKYWNIDYVFVFTGYDDSMSFIELLESGEVFDVELILIDTEHFRVRGPDFLSWLESREKYLMEATGSNVVSAVFSSDISVRVNGEIVQIFHNFEHADFYDSRYKKSTGSRLTPSTHYLLARELSAVWLPEKVIPPKKLIAVDLDFTLHSGILGEEGLRVMVDNQFRELQQELVDAKNRGLMLAVLTKNDQRDVLYLLSNHPDYVLRQSDFVTVDSSWGSKTDALARILIQTRIGQDSVIFIDDNPVELLQMSAVFPGITCVSADKGPAIARKTLRSVPGYRRSTIDYAADLRVRDIQSNEDRERLITNGLTTYYKRAEPILKISVNRAQDLERLVDLGKRSNQFNLLLSRCERIDYESHNAVWVALSLEDRFSDSGVIGGILCSSITSDECTVLDLFLSCRVLGRGLETPLICSGLMAAMNYLNNRQIRLSWVVGQRNEPALKWLSSDLLSTPVDVAGSIIMTIKKIEELSNPPTGVRVEIER